MTGLGYADRKADSFTRLPMSTTVKADLEGGFMHYYKRNIGDYAKKAGRLTMLQHGAYTLLLDACYDREAFPTLDQAIEWTWASTDAEIDAVKFVLARFFTVSQDGEYVQNRILEEVLVYHKNAETNKRIALERETKRKQNSTNRATESTKREQPVDEAPPNHKPLTNNHKPITSDSNDTSPKGRSTRLPNDWELPDEWAIWTKENRPELNPNQVADSFKDYWIAVAGVKGKKQDWFATWRNWVRNQRATNKHSEPPWEREKREWYEQATGKSKPYEKDIFDLSLEEQRLRIAK